MQKEECSTCKNFKPDYTKPPFPETGGVQVMWGRCRAGGPQRAVLIVDGKPVEFSGWPEVLSNEWCDQYKNKIAHQLEEADKRGHSPAMAQRVGRPSAITEFVSVEQKKQKP